MERSNIIYFTRFILGRKDVEIRYHLINLVTGWSRAGVKCLTHPSLSRATYRCLPGGCVRETKKQITHQHHGVGRKDPVGGSAK
jgi:hypothetical protein